MIVKLRQLVMLIIILFLTGCTRLTDNIDNTINVILKDNNIVVNTNKTGVLDITFDLLNLINNTSNVTNSYLEYKIIITYGDNNE